jgi:hypothetical protein
MLRLSLREKRVLFWFGCFLGAVQVIGGALILIFARDSGTIEFLKIGQAVLFPGALWLCLWVVAGVSQEQLTATVPISLENAPGVVALPDESRSK